MASRDERLSLLADPGAFIFCGLFETFSFFPDEIQSICDLEHL